MRAFGGTSDAPCAPIARFAEMSSSRIAWASASRRARTWSSGRAPEAIATRRIRSSAQNRLTAVGRVAASPLTAVSRSAIRPSNVAARLSRAASTTPKAAATPIAGAPRTTSARTAARATGAAVTRRRSVASCQPTISSRDARGWTRSDSRVASALAVVLVLAELGRHHPIVALERRAEILDQLAADAAQGLDLAPDPRLLGPAFLDDLLAPQLGLAHLQLRFLACRRLHLVAEPVGRHERVLQRALALVEAARSLLEGRDLLLQLRVLLEHGLVVLGDVVEKGIDLVDVKATKPLDAELLLTDIERTDTHEASDVLAHLGGDSVQHRDQEFLQKIQHENHDHR